ncbi:MAG: S9 family peptidase [Cyclobacteriaceae bacterium]|nr:S9 family peptidase [Cyclobacteriaceae bacterium]
MQFRILVSLLLVSTLAVAQKKTTVQPVVKKPLDPSVYDGWKDITYKALTPDGSYAAFTVNPQEGDGKVVFYNLKTNAQDSVKRATEITLTFDSKHAVFKIKPQQQLVKDLRRQKKKKEDMPKDSLGIFTFATRKTEKIANVKSFKVPEKAGQWAAWQLEAAKEEKPKAKPDTAKKAEPAKPKKVKKNSDDNGYTLVLRNLDTRQDIQFGFVKDYAFAKFGQGLLFHTTGNDSTLKAGMYWYDLQKAELKSLQEGKPKYKYKGLATSEDGTQASFLLDTDTTKAPNHFFSLYYWKSGDNAASVLVHEKTAQVPASWFVSEHATPTFSKDGKSLFFGLAPKPLTQDTTRLEEEIIKVEVWNWKDSVLQTQQNSRLEADKKRSYQTAINLNDKSIALLGNATVPQVVLADEGNAAIALGVSDRPYRWSNFYDISGYSDAYIIDVKTGNKNKVAEKVKGNISISPKGNFVFWFSLPDTAWFAYDVAGNKKQSLTKALPVSFADEEDDHPDYPSSYGFAGWLENDARFLVYDRYDIWSIDPQGKTPAVNLTKVGRNQKITFRNVWLNREEKFIKPEATLLLTAFDEQARTAGYYSLSLKTGELKKLISGNYRYAGVSKALNSDNILFTRETFNEFPDVWASNLTFANPKKISNANPQQKNYLWGTVELVNYTSLDNVPLQGLLYKPENFDPKKKYPMLVYFYEKSSDGLYSYSKPQPAWSIIQRVMCVSNGYLVFIPDIVYKNGLPGESAYNCIMPGVNQLISQGFVDEKNIGIQGQSWGGYQTAYIITRTNLFKAAGAGAAVVNMTSAYGGIRWGSGMSRMFQYEQSQSRIGGTLWEKPLYFIENSPLFYADKIQTPVLIMQNDKDDAVPWYQGIEFYMALRRLHKPVWMLVYNDEVHNLQKRQNRKDYDIRLMQFFDYYLKGAPEPEWMKKGIPAIEKGITKGY